MTISFSNSSLRLFRWSLRKSYMISIGLQPVAAGDVRDAMTGPDSLYIHHWLPSVRDSLGPGRRAVVWVQGCSLACPGCMVPETWHRPRGREVYPLELADRILAQEGLDGITISGGEPTEQPEAVRQLLARVCAAGLNTWVYTGRTLEDLLAEASAPLDAMLAQVDVLVDGPYDSGLAGALRLRGSANQRILHLTGAIPAVLDDQGEFSRVEISINEAGELVVIGVPPPGFLRGLRDALKRRGITVFNDRHWTER